ncbi:hypothetical protein Ssi02_50080 [Sinosporangium siamense]|uniref:Uncharacterized protein n=1 Tax=Sinosporangium siamense TaxID=1367973 RepID=A0A919RJ50_9ACTN|nr:hypothetical protein Ssi02_50080 [Sinosporangium siamense]
MTGEGRGGEPCACAMGTNRLCEAVCEDLWATWGPPKGERSMGMDDRCVHNICHRTVFGRLHGDTPDVPHCDMHLFDDSDPSVNK